MLCPDKPRNSGKHPEYRFERDGRDVVTFTRRNGSITMTVEAYMKLTEPQRKNLHKAWRD